MNTDNNDSGPILASEDVVLCMGPETEKVWPAVLGQRELRCFRIDTPPMGWHKQTAPQDATWAHVAQGIRRTVALLRGEPCRRIHLFAHGPFSLLSLLAMELEEGLSRNRQIIVYQLDAKTKSWRPWGTLGQPIAPPGSAPLLALPAVSSLASSGAESRDVVVSLNVLHQVQRAEVEPALAAQGCPPVFEPVRGCLRMAPFALGLVASALDRRGLARLV